jgi:ribosomal protein S18 acetylase RimI-like enzyme
MDVTFRRATSEDSDLLANLVLGEPEQETTRVGMALFGMRDFDEARGVFRMLWRAGESWRQSELAVLDGRPAGVIQTGRSSVRITPAVIFSALRAMGPATLLRMPSRLRIQGRVSPKKPEGAYVISEIHVAPDCRGRRIGEAMMAHAEADARKRRFPMMALHTLTTNPARSFYERLGFTVAAEATDPEFERLTGVKGNVLYVKQLD